jgi:hypothetical protein
LVTLPNTPFQRQNPTTFWPVTETGENVTRRAVRPRFYERSEADRHMQIFKQLDAEQAAAKAKRQ